MALETKDQWQAALEGWQRSKQMQKLASSTQHELIKRLNQFAKQITPLGPWQVTRKDINGWLAAKDLSANSRYHRKAALRNFYRWAQTQGRIKDNPADEPAHPLAIEVPSEWQKSLNQFATWQKSKGHSANMLKKYREKLSQLANETGAPTPWRLSASELAEWIGGHKWSRETARQARTCLRCFYRWANKFGYTPTNPALALDPVRTVPALPRPASENAYHQALDEAGPRVDLMLRLSAQLGLRRSEVAALHTNDLNPDSYGGYWLDVLGKGDKRRAVPVPDELATMIKQRPKGWLFPNGKGGHLSAHYVGKLVANALPEGVTMHQLRHRFATRAYQASRDIYAVQQLLGHSSPAVTQRYVAIDLGQLRTVVNAVAS